MKHALYFAYGSVLDLGPSTSPLPGVNATLRGYRLAPATRLVPDRNAVVPGTLYELPVSALDGLDDAAWLRTRRSVRAADGRRCKAWVYLRPGIAPGADGVS